MGLKLCPPLCRACWSEASYSTKINSCLKGTQHPYFDYDPYNFYYFSECSEKNTMTWVDKGLNSRYCVRYGTGDIKFKGTADLYMLDQFNYLGNSRNYMYKVGTIHYNYNGYVHTYEYKFNTDDNSLKTLAALCGMCVLTDAECRKFYGKKYIHDKSTIEPNEMHMESGDHYATLGAGYSNGNGEYLRTFNLVYGIYNSSYDGTYFLQIPTPLLTKRPNKKKESSYGHERHLFICANDIGTKIYPYAEILWSNDSNFADCEYHNMTTEEDIIRSSGTPDRQSISTMQLEKLNKLTGGKLYNNSDGTQSRSPFTPHDLGYSTRYIASDHTVPIAYIDATLLPNTFDVFKMDGTQFKKLGVMRTELGTGCYTYTNIDGTEIKSRWYEKTSFGHIPVYGVLWDNNTEFMYDIYIHIDSITYNKDTSVVTEPAFIKIELKVNDGGISTDSANKTEQPKPQPTLWDSILNNASDKGIYDEELQMWKDTYDFSYSNDIQAKSFNSVIGLPFQFMESADPRLGENMYGKQY